MGDNGLSMLNQSATIMINKLDKWKSKKMSEIQLPPSSSSDAKKKERDTNEKNKRENNQNTVEEWERLVSVQKSQIIQITHLSVLNVKSQIPLIYTM